MDRQEAWAAYDTACADFRAAISRNDFAAAEDAVVRRKAAWAVIDAGLEAAKVDFDSRCRALAEADAAASRATKEAEHLGDLGAVVIATDDDDYW